MAAFVYSAAAAAAAAIASHEGFVQQVAVVTRVVSRGEMRGTDPVVSRQVHPQRQHLRVGRDDHLHV